MSAVPQRTDPLLDRLEGIESELRRLADKIGQDQGVTRLYLTKQELAETLGVSPRWIDKQIALPKHRRMPSHEIAGRRKFRLRDVIRWIEEEERR